MTNGTSRQAGKLSAVPEVDVIPTVLSQVSCRDSAGNTRRLPTFFIVGPPRTGTSWLHNVLSGHTLLPDPTKETRFFDMHFSRGLNWYLNHYSRAAGNRRVGEVAPTYFESSEARERISQTVPDARVICVFRNPVQRVVSLYRVKRAYGMIPWSLEEAVVRDPELMASSQYASHLKAWRAAFGPDHVMAAVYDDLRDQPQQFLDALLDFIGAPRLELTRSQIRRVHGSDSMTQPRHYYWTRSANLFANWLKARRCDRLVASIRSSPLRKLFLGGGPAFSAVSPEAARRLCQLFRPQVEELETILNRDLTAWKSVALASYQAETS